MRQFSKFMFCIFVSLSFSLYGTYGQVINNDLIPIKNKNMVETDAGIFDMTKGNTLGKVKTITKKYYSVKKMSAENPSGLKSYAFDTFSQNGLKSGSIFFSKDRKKESEWHYIQKGQQAVIEKYHYTDDGSIYLKIIYKVDSLGNVFENYEENCIHRLDSKAISKFDKKANLIEWAKYNSKGLLSWKKINAFDYNAKTCNALTIMYDSAGKEIVKNTFSYKYNSDGKRVEEIQQSGRIEDNTKTIFVYDSMGRLSEKFFYYNTGALYLKMEYSYHERENKIKNIYFLSDGKADNLRKDEWLYKYDENGNETEHLFFHNGALSDEYSFVRDYLYDETGNIIKDRKYIFESSKPVLAEYTETEINYY